MESLSETGNLFDAATLTFIRSRFFLAISALRE